MFSKLPVNTPERRQFAPFSSVSIFDFEQVNVSWDHALQFYIDLHQVMLDCVLFLSVLFDLTKFFSFREANQLSAEMKKDSEFAVTLQVHSGSGDVKEATSESSFCAVLILQ